MEDPDMNAAARPTLDFDALVREHQDRVYRVACRVLHDPAGAEDVAQQVFLKLYQDGGLPSGVANPTAYVARAAVNTALKSVRSEDRRDRREQAPRPRAATQDPALRLVVREAVDDLPSDLKVPIVLHYFEGLGYEEVSDALGIPAGTVAWRISEAKGKLRASLAGIGAALTVAAVDSALEGADEVSSPPTLAAKLRAIPRAPKAPVAAVPPQLPAGPILGIGAPLAIALLLLFVGGLVVVTSWRPTTRVVHRTVDLPTGPAVVATATAPGGAPPAATPRPAASAPTADVDEPMSPAARQGEEELEGFLYRDGAGRMGLWTDDDETKSWRPSRRLLLPASAAPFEGLVLGGREVGGVRWGTAGPEAAPRVHVRLRAVVREEAPAEGTVFAIEWLDVQEVLGVECLSDGWVEAWGRCGQALLDFGRGTDEVPSEAKRTRLREDASVAAREIETLARHRSTDDRPAALRAYPLEDRWRRGGIWLLREILDGKTSWLVGRVSQAQETPDVDDLKAMFLSATDQASFRRGIVERYSEEALAEGARIWCYATMDEKYDLGGAWLHDMAEVWTPVEFRDHQTVARAAAAKEAKAPTPEKEPSKGLTGGFEEAGIECERPSEEEVRAVMNGGALRVKGVVAGGKADRAGMRTGDLLWGVEPLEAPADGVGRELASPYVLGDLLERQRKTGGDEVTVVVLRDGELVRIRIPAR